MTQLPPNHVLEAFGLSGEPVPAGMSWDLGWRYDSMVLSQVADSARAAWSAKLRETLQIDGIHVARPGRTTDGRHVLSGWQSRHWMPGNCAPRADEILVAAVRIDEALSGISRPQFLVNPDPNVFSVCDRAVWSDNTVAELSMILDPDAIPRPDAAEALTVASSLLRLRGDIAGETQLTHGDVVGTLLFDGATEPVLTDIVPRWRVKGWGAAVAAVDCLAFLGADEDLLARFDHIPEWNELLIRAVCFRLLAHAAFPESKLSSWRGLARAAEIVRSMVTED